MTALLIILPWLACAVFCASVTLAFFQREFTLIAKETYRNDLAMSWGLGLFFGPVSALVVVFMTGFVKHGFMNPFRLSPVK